MRLRVTVLMRKSLETVIADNLTAKWHYTVQWCKAVKA